jgi:hypothetical protein
MERVTEIARKNLLLRIESAQVRTLFGVDLLSLNNFLYKNPI